MLLLKQTFYGLLAALAFVAFSADWRFWVSFLILAVLFPQDDDIVIRIRRLRS